AWDEPHFDVAPRIARRVAREFERRHDAVEPRFELALLAIGRDEAVADRGGERDERHPQHEFDEGETASGHRILPCCRHLASCAPRPGAPGVASATRSGLSMHAQRRIINRRSRRWTLGWPQPSPAAPKRARRALPGMRKKLLLWLLVLAGGCAIGAQ